MYDILIKNAHLVDSNHSIYTDLAIKNGIIEKIDKDIDVSSARNVIDVEGKIVMPGIIDPQDKHI